MQRSLILVFFFFSGMTGLVFEVIWSRMLTQVFGSSTFALSALLTAFMTGLALGSELLGRRAARVARPLRWYGLLEICIGAYALLVPFLLGGVSRLYAPLFQTLSAHFYAFSLLRFALVCVVLLAPTLCMGATLPLLTQHIARAKASGWEGSAGLLYGVNTLGACLGTVLSGFVLLPTLGQQATNLTVALMSCTLGATVVLYDAARHRAASADAPSPGEVSDEDSDEDDADGATLDLFADAPEHRLPRRMVWACMGALGVAGAVSMTYQVLWTRAYVMILGSSTYSFSLILATFLVGLGGGSALMSALLGYVRRPVWLLALIQLGVALGGAVCFYTLNKAPELLFWHLRIEGRTMANVFFYNVFLIALVVLVPTLLQGMTFPLVVRVVGASARAAASARGDAAAAQADAGQAGRLVGRAYALNTVGAIVGSFASGFVLLPLIGLRYGMGLAVGASVAVALVFGAMALRVEWRPLKAAALAAALAVALGVFAAAPELNLTRLSSGAFRVYWSRELFKPKAFLNDTTEALFYSDGIAATISVEKRGGLFTLKANGKPEASDGADMATQILVGLLPLVLHEATPHARQAQAAGTYRGPRDVAMVGFGSGVTAGASLQSTLDRLDVVEIEPAMMEASRWFDHVNHRPLEDPRLTVIESDGRNFLEYTGAQYDVIVSEPSNPWIAGVASLFTLEHFTRARRKLKPGGLFCQWVQLYELRPENVSRVFKTFRAAFPHALIFSSMEKGTDLIMIGSEQPLTLPPGGYPIAWSHDATRRELARANVHHPHDLYALLFLGDSAIDPFIQAQERDLGHAIALNTDDNAVLEYEAPRDLVHYDQADRFFASIYYGDAIYGDMRPYLEGLDDPARWPPDALAHLARAAFAKGKQRLAGDLAAEALRRGPSQEAERVRSAWQLYDRDPQDAVLHYWPSSASRAAQLLSAATAQQAPLPTLELLYATRPRDEDRFDDPEDTLLAAWLLWRVRNVKRAHAQLLHLRDDHPALLQRTPLVHLLLGFTFTKQRRYDDAFEAFAAYARATEGRAPVPPAPASAPASP